MTNDELERVLQDIPGLRGLFVTAMPDALLFQSWTRRGENWAGEEVASYFGDLIRANGRGLRAMKAWSQDVQITIEAGEMVLLLRELPSDFVVGFIFEASAPLGCVRVHVDRVLGLLDQTLPKVKPEERPRAVRVSDFLIRYAPDTHTALQRAALRSGLSLEQLRKPEQLTPNQVEDFETSVCEILGLDSLSL